MMQRARIVNYNGTTVLEGPKFFIQGIAEDFEERYPGQYTVEPATWWAWPFTDE
jgi:hypothetical protein